MKKIAIIPARGGSKKNSQEEYPGFLGKPVISYSIEAALKSNLFDEVMVSTDDEEIKEIAQKYGAEVPFLRSVKTSNDFATLTDVLIEVINEYRTIGINWDLVCCILPTAPFVVCDDLKYAYEIMQKLNSECILPVLKFSYPVQRALQADERDSFPCLILNTLKQEAGDLPPRFHDAGQYYMIKTETLFYEKTLFPHKTSGVEIDELKVQDIDTETDWKIAELKYKLLHENK